MITINTRAELDAITGPTEEKVAFFRTFGTDRIVYLKNIKGEEGKPDFVGIFSADGIGVFAAPSVELAALEARNNDMDSVLVH